MKSKTLLIVSAILSFMVAVFQAAVSFSPAWSLYFGAPRELTSNPTLLYLVGLAAAFVFVVFGLYALAGAGAFRPLPALRWGLLGIGGIYTLRGLMAVPLILIGAGLLQADGTLPPQAMSSSLVSLFIGLVYLFGTALGWREIPGKANG